MKPSEQLKAAKELIKDPANWIKGRFSDGKGCFCIVGALDKAVSGEKCIEATWFLAGAIPDSRRYGIPGFNDHPDTTHTDVMRAYDDAIATAEKQEAKEVPAT